MSNTIIKLPETPTESKVFVEGVGYYILDTVYTLYVVDDAANYFIQQEL